MQTRTSGDILCPLKSHREVQSCTPKRRVGRSNRLVGLFLDAVRSAEAETGDVTAVVLEQKYKKYL